MHTFGETGTGVPAFLAKLWRLVEDPETNHLICWSKDGRSFILQNQAQFARDLLPLNYKHNNMASFIRQLNMYGFHKITSIDNGGLKFDRDEMEFSHPYFKRDCPYLLENIKRKIANTKQTVEEKATVKTEAVGHVLNEVKVMRGRQDSLDSRFSVMKQENEALWREIATLRQKHMKQQQIVNKLIQFLVTIVQPSRNMSGVKRHFQLMINDTPQNPKTRKPSETDNGPIIHELTEGLLDEVTEDDECDLMNSVGQNIMSPGGTYLGRTGTESPIERPQSNVSNASQIFYDHSNMSMDDAFSQNNNGASISVNPNGSPIVYHVTELPETLENTEMKTEENVLNTPLVHKQMSRTQSIQIPQQKNRRRKIATSKASTSASAAKQARIELEPLHIKTEMTEVDPMSFLHMSPNLNDQQNSAGQNFNDTFNAAMISPNNSNSQQMGNIQTGDYINDSIPTELFQDDSGMLSDLNLVAGTYGDKFDLKFKPSSSGTASGSNVVSSPSGSNTKSLTLAKYNNSKYVQDEEIKRLSTTADDVNSHLDIMQDDLDNLKDILRGEGYTLDANTLLGKNGTTPNRIYLSQPLDGDILAKLFGESDILNPYGLSLNTENSQDNSRKGSELMTYQPYSTDFGDIFDINLKDAETTEPESQTESSSVLNTPSPYTYHETFN